MEERDYGETPMKSGEKCSSAAGCCFWDNLVESFKLKAKSKQGSADQAMSATADMQLDQQRQEHEQEILRQREDFERQLKEHHDESQRKEIENDEQMKAEAQNADSAIETLRRELQVSKERVMEVQNKADLIQQYEFVVPNFSKLKNDKVKYSTPPIYSHPGGYKMVLEIALAGQKAGAGSDISVIAFSQVGEYDANLTFPAKIYITFQLLNQADRREGHHTKQMACVYSSSEKGKFLGSVQQFISFVELERKAETYLKNNQLWFRIIEIRVDTMKGT